MCLFPYTLAFWLSCPCCLVMVVLSSWPCPESSSHFNVLAIMFWLSCPLCPVQTDLLGRPVQNYMSDYPPILADWLSFPSCHVSSCNLWPSCPLHASLSGPSSQAYLSTWSCLRRHFLALLSRLSCHGRSVPVVLSKLSCSVTFLPSCHLSSPGSIITTVSM